jgi:hypothetical protein
MWREEDAINKLVAFTKTTSLQLTKQYQECNQRVFHDYPRVNQLAIYV